MARIPTPKAEVARLMARAKKSKRSKYGVRTDAAGKAARTVDGILFASLKEARRYGVLKLLAKAGKITNFALQPPFKLFVATADGGIIKSIGHWIADFQYVEDGKVVIEDAKGHRTALFNWKLKHFETQYGVRVRIT